MQQDQQGGQGKQAHGMQGQRDLIRNGQEEGDIEPQVFPGAADHPPTDFGRLDEESRDDVVPESDDDLIRADDLSRRGADEGDDA